MKRTHRFALAALALLPAAPFAQPAGSTLSVYGLADVSLRRATNTDTASGGRAEMDNGMRTASRLGLRGSEALGGDLSAVFMLEMGLDPGGGTSGDAARTFNRFSFLGLKSRTLGELTAGRQNSSIHELLAFHGFDALEVGSHRDWTPHAGSQYAPKYDNALRYARLFGPFAASVLGVIDDSEGKDVSHPLGATLVYQGGGWQLGGAYMQEDPGGAAAPGGKRRSLAAGGRYQSGALRLSGFYLGHRNPGAGRRDRTYAAGLGYDLGPRLQLLARVLHTQTRIAGAGGRRSVGVLLAEYRLSPRTQPYAGLDYTRFSGVAVPASGARTRLGLAVGMRHRF